MGLGISASKDSVLLISRSNILGANAGCCQLLLPKHCKATILDCNIRNYCEIRESGVYILEPDNRPIVSSNAPYPDNIYYLLKSDSCFRIERVRIWPLNTTYYQTYKGITFKLNERQTVDHDPNVCDIIMNSGLNEMFECSPGEEVYIPILKNRELIEI